MIWWIDNDVGDELASMISELLKVNSTLTSLKLSGDGMRERERERERMHDNKNDKWKRNREQYWRWRSKNDKRSINN